MSDSQNNAVFDAVSLVLGGYDPGFDLIAGAHPNSIERFIVLCVKGTPRLLLPPGGPVMRTAIASFLGNRRFAYMVPSLVRVASWTGGCLSYVVSDASLVSQNDACSPLRELISTVLGRDDFQLALRLSFGRPNAKTVVMAISDAGEALCFAKLGSEAMTNDLVAHESAILEQFENNDMPLVTPRRLYSGAWAGGHNVLITAALQLDPLNSDAGAAHQAADAFAIHNCVPSCALSASTYWQQIAGCTEKPENCCDDGNALHSLIARIEKTWGGNTYDFGASHGDWTRANLGMVDGRVAALDWERYKKDAPRGLDIAHFTICESSAGSFSSSFDIEQVAECVRQNLKVAGLPPEHAQLLVVLALLEMVIRFKSAHNVGLQSIDSKFGPALQAGVQKWAL